MKGYGSRWDAWSDEARRRGVWRATTTYVVVALGVLEWAKAALRSGRLVELLAVLAAFGFPVVCLLSWHFKVSLEVGPDGSVEESGGPGATAWCLVALVIGVAVAAAWWVWGRLSTTP